VPPNPPPTAPHARPRLAALDGLRLVAAVAVMSFHYSGIFTPFWDAAPHVVFPTLNEFTRFGYLGVELFFIISGFVILMTAYDRSIESFAASRVARLFPAYWVAIVLTFTLQAFWDAGRQPSFVEALVNLTMVQDPYGMPHVQGAFWTLWIELKFYLLIGVFILVGMSRRRMIAFALLWPLMGQIASATSTTFLVSLLSPTYAPYFAAGICLFLLHREGHDIATWLVLGFNWVLCVRQATGYAERVSDLVRAPVSPLVTGIAVSLMILVVLAVTHGPISRIGWGWLTWAGALTYPLYLVHGQFGFFVIDRLHQDYSPYVVLAAAALTCFVLAFLIHLLVERPFARPLRRAVERSLKATALPPTPAAEPVNGHAAPNGHEPDGAPTQPLPRRPQPEKLPD
jgi:peptidoglycan/LPS O-acetylase OafA/YrhL